MKKPLVYFWNTSILAILLLAGYAYAAGFPISVPSAPSKGYALVSTSTGQYLATSTTPFHIGSLFASSTTATSTIMGFLNVGNTNTNFYPNAPFLGTCSVNNYCQTVIQDLSGGNNASSNFIVQNDIGNDSIYYGEFGINSSGYSQAAFNSQAASDVYLSSSDSNLLLGTASTTGPAAIKFFTAGTLTANVRAVITATGLVGIGTTTPYANLSVLGLASSTSLSLFAVASTTNIGGTFSTTTALTVTNYGPVGIGTTSPYASLTVTNPATTSVPAVLLSVSSSTVPGSAYPLFQIDKNGHLITGGQRPNVSVCGTSPQIFGNDIAGNVQVGTGAATSCTVTYATAYTVAPSVGVWGSGPSNTTAGGEIMSSSTATGFSFMASSTAFANMNSWKINYFVIATSTGN